MAFVLAVADDFIFLVEALDVDNGVAAFLNRAISQGKQGGQEGPLAGLLIRFIEGIGLAVGSINAQCLRHPRVYLLAEVKCHASAELVSGRGRVGAGVDGEHVLGVARRYAAASPKQQGQGEKHYPGLHSLPSNKEYGDSTLALNTGRTGDDHSSHTPGQP